jgi:poly(glycerol-phosphate) alpha-glucosyltransferase
MKINFVISSLSRTAGGTSACVPMLAREIARKGHSVRLFTIADAGAPNLCEGVEVIAARPSWPRRLAASADLKDRMNRDGDGDLFHAHGLWELPTHYAARSCRRKGTPYLISPHGMLEAWALQRSPWRKRVMGWLYQNMDLSGADCLHALTQGEKESIRRYGLKNPVAVAPNGIDLAEMDRRERFGALFEERFPRTRGRRVALFLSRVHPKKGLLPLAEAWGKIHREFSDWLLVIAGPDPSGHQAEVERTVRSSNAADSVLFSGPLYDEIKLSALAAAKIFVLPSFSEGFSMAVLEALACRLPVLITPGCNFPEVAEGGAGLLCQPEPAGIAEALRALLRMSEKDRLDMGARGRRMVEEKHAWNTIAGSLIEVYEWILGRKGRPSCVLAD